MKKIFTLIATVLFAFAANAATPIPMNFSSWGGGCVIEGNTITYSAAWEGAGSWIAIKDEAENVHGYDMGDAEYMWLTFAEGATVDVKVVTQYTDSYVEGAAGTSSTNVMSGTLVAGYALDPALKHDVFQYFLQSTSGAGTITVTGAFCGSKAEFEAALAGDVTEKVKELPLPTADGIIEMPGVDDAGWYAAPWIGLSNLDVNFKTLVFEVASADEHFKLMVQGSEDGSEWNDDGFTTFHVAKTAEPIIIALPVEGKHKNLGQYAFQNMNITDTSMDPSTGEMVSEYGDNKVVVKRVYLTSEVVGSTFSPYVEETDGITTVNVAADSAVMYNIAGQRVSRAKGIVIMNGRKYITK